MGSADEVERTPSCVPPCIRFSGADELGGFVVSPFHQLGDTEPDLCAANPPQPHGRSLRGPSRRHAALEHDAVSLHENRRAAGSPVRTRRGATQERDTAGFNEAPGGDANTTAGVCGPFLSYRYRSTAQVAAEVFSRHLIRLARRQAHLSQADLAMRAGTSQPAVSAYESGKRSPSVDTLCRLLAAAGFELRMQLAAPDTHGPALRRAEAILPADQVDAHHERERRRVASVRARRATARAGS